MIITSLRRPQQLFSLQQHHARCRAESFDLVDEYDQPGTIKKRQQIKPAGAAINQLYVLRQGLLQQVHIHPRTGVIAGQQRIADADNSPQPRSPIVILLRASPLQ